jgi:carbon-monoxide dehydrogenase small subunit
MSAHALLETTPRPTRGQVEEGLAGNYCRCGGYEQIIEAVLLAAEGVPEPDADTFSPHQAATPDARVAPQ